MVALSGDKKPFQFFVMNGFQIYVGFLEIRVDVDRDGDICFREWYGRGEPT